MNKSPRIEKIRAAAPVGALAFVFLILLLLLVYQLWLSYRDHVKTAEINTSNFAAVFEARIDATLRRADAELLSLSADLPRAALDAGAASGYKREIDGKLDARLFNMDEMAGYQVFDAEGELLYSSKRLKAHRESVAGKAFFRRLRGRAGSEPVFSDVFDDDQFGCQCMAVAGSLRDGNGEFVGVIAGLIDLDHYRQQFQSLNLGKHGVVAWRRTDNHAQVVRWPNSRGGANGMLAPDHPVVLRMASGEKRILLHYEVFPENVRRIMTVRRMHKYPFYVAVGAGEDDVLAGWRKEVMVVAVSSLLLFGIVGTLLFRLGRMRRREAGILSDLARRESQFRNLARMVPVGICHFDDEGKYTYVNERYLTITGRRREDLMRGWWWNFIHPEDRLMMEDCWWRCKNRMLPFISEYRFVCPDGQWVYVLGEIQAEIEPGTGRLLGYVAALTDITQRKRVEAELRVAREQAESANVAKTRFLAAASHDLRQPIQAINLFKDALERTDLNDEQRSISAFLSRSVRALSDLLHSLLDFSRLDAGQIRPQMMPVLVGDLFKAIDAEFSSLARQKGLRFKLFYPFKDAYIVTDPDLLMRVLRNLIDNAFKYTGKGGLLMAFRKREGYGAIQVWDTGIGIEEHIGERVFEECFQAGNSERDRARGIGLGLSIVRRTANLLGGDARYRSRLGRGSMFEISCPLSESVPEAVAHAQTEPRIAGQEGGENDSSRFKGRRVALIEDDPVVAKSVQLALGGHGMRINVFGSAEQALPASGILDVDFYITDFNLPGMNGVALLEAIGKRSA